MYSAGRSNECSTELDFGNEWLHGATLPGGISPARRMPWHHWHHAQNQRFLCKQSFVHWSNSRLVAYTQTANSCHSFQKSMRLSWRDSSIFVLCWRGCIFVWRKDRHVLVGEDCSLQLGFLIPHGGIKEVSKQAHFTRGEVGITFDAKKCQSINV